MKMELLVSLPMKKITFFFVFFFLLSSPKLMGEIRSSKGFRGGYVQSVDDFQYHIYLHKHRVVMLGLYLAHKYRHEIPEVPEGSLVRYLQLHDESKVNRASYILSHHGYMHKMPPVDRLWSYFGYDMDELSPQAQQDFRDLIRETNFVDQSVAADLFWDQGLVDENGHADVRVRLLKQLERVADLTDRGMDPVAAQEFNRVMSLASEFLDSPWEKRWARGLEDVYAHLLEPYTLPARQHCREFLK